MLKERLLLRIVRILPKNLYSRWVGRIGGIPLPRRLRRRVHLLYARRYKVRTEEVALPLEDYPSLRAFFTRTLKSGVRPFDPRPHVIPSPCDGRIAASGTIDEGRLLQIKGREYDLHGLLQDPEAEGWFRHGSYTTVYLSPSDYHRVHFPVSGRVLGFRYLPGTLFPVNDPAVRNIDELFVINERLTTYIESERWGHVAVVMVGATAVGRISVSYDPIETNRPGRRHEQRVLYSAPLQKESSDELGIFHLGSTVVLLCECPALQLVQPEGNVIRLGQPLLIDPCVKA